ncbi:MAG TPA: hypothetical protein VFN68_02800 [Acidimicrobiales bacterium]|nr:hypothetical protein [Acidimicrobiales bacterium]
MQRITVSGPEPVASLLRSVAEGIMSGRVRLGEETFECAPTISAAVEFPDRAQGTEILTLALHFGRPAERRHPLEVEQELTHPGG